MKTLLIASLTSLFVAGSAFANELDLNTIPEVTDQAVEALEAEATEAIEEATEESEETVESVEQLEQSIAQ